MHTKVLVTESHKLAFKKVVDRFLIIVALLPLLYILLRVIAFGILTHKLLEEIEVTPVHFVKR